MSSYIYTISIYNLISEMIFGDLEIKKAEDVFQGSKIFSGEVQMLKKKNLWKIFMK